MALSCLATGTGLSHQVQVVVDPRHAMHEVHVAVAVYNSAAALEGGKHYALWFHTNSGHNVILQVKVSGRPVRKTLLKLGLPLRNQYYMADPVYKEPGRSKALVSTIRCGRIPAGTYPAAISTIQAMTHRPWSNCKDWVLKVLKRLTDAGHLVWQDGAKEELVALVPEAKTL